jgi:hypothetical protein
MYKVELLAGPRDEADDQTMAESYVRTALELRELGDLAFFGRFGGETARVLTYFPSLSADEAGRRVFDLHQRHARVIGDVLKSGCRRNLCWNDSGALQRHHLSDHAARSMI